MVGRIGTLARGGHRCVLHRAGTFETAQDVTAESLGMQVLTDAFRGPENPCAQGMAPRHRDHRDVGSKARLEKDRRVALLGDTPGRMGNDAGRADEAIVLDGIGDRARHL